MANFLAVVDPDPSRRAACVSKAAELLHILPGLRRGDAKSGSFASVWSAAELAPISSSTDERGAGIVWGDALASAGRVDAALLRRSWRRLAPMPGAFDGFHAGVTFDETDGLVVGADLLGLFPVYYWASKDVVLVGTSIAAFRAHPSFASTLDPLGLTGILLTGGLVDNVTIWSGVRRLAPGCLLTWSRENGLAERVQFELPMQETLGAHSFDDHVDALDAALDDAIARHVRGDGETGLLLSGGRDSRVVAGLHHRRGGRANALTFGEPHDYEVQCASPVANALGFSHAVLPDSLDGLDEIVRLHVRQEQLTHGMSTVFTWRQVPQLAAFGGSLLSGYVIEAFIGGEVRELPRGRANDPAARVIDQATSYGISPDRLRRLVRRDVFGDAIDESLEHMRAAYAARDADPDRRAWHFALQHRARFHPGSIPWRLSLGSWPVMLCLDQKLLELSAGLPLSTVANRRGEDALLRTHFPALARLPLDRATDDTTPLAPTASWRLRSFIDRARTTPAAERRRYHRIFDINAPGWRAIRELAEPCRRHAAELFDTAEFDALLPPPNVAVEPPYPVAGSNGLKSLLGLLIWLDDRA